MPDIETAAPEGAAHVMPFTNGATEPAAVAEPLAEAEGGRVRGGPIVTMPNGRRGPPLRAYPIEKIEQVKALVTGTDMTVEAIAREVGVSVSTVRRWMRIYDWERPLVPPRRRRKPATKTEAGDRRQQLASRVYRNLGRQLGHLEKRLKAASGESAEKDARTLGILAKTLLTLKELDRDGAKVGEPEPVDRDDLEELDADLARRIDAWASGGADD